jgi:hypothetical protein
LAAAAASPCTSALAIDRAQHVELARRLGREAELFRAEEFDRVGKRRMRHAADVARQIMHVVPAGDLEGIARQQRARGKAQRRLFLAQRRRRLVAETEIAGRLAQLDHLGLIGGRGAQHVRLRDDAAAGQIGLARSFGRGDLGCVDRRLAGAGASPSVF